MVDSMAVDSVVASMAADSVVGSTAVASIAVYLLAQHSVTDIPMVTTGILMGTPTRILMVTNPSMTSAAMKLRSIRITSEG
jgi:hypothetical protein